MRQKTDSKLRDFFYPQFSSFQALNSLSFHVNQGEKVAFIGPNGAGKSTTIKAILGILHYDTGEIGVFGKDPRTERKVIAKQTSSVFGQRSQLLYHLPLIDSFNFFRIIYEIPSEVFQQRLDRFVNRFGVEEFLYQPVRKLSLGQRMKGEIIASLLHSPKAIFLDEPTVGLDIIAKKVLYEILNEIHKEEHITIFLTSHDLNDIENLCERAIVINRGAILYDGQLEDLMKEYANKKFIRYKEADSLDWETVEIENTPALLQKVVKHLLETKNIEDIMIENLPLEEVIEEFYR
jgi:ABC-2 type transport system ATP-binding protein